MKPRTVFRKARKERSPDSDDVWLRGYMGEDIPRIRVLIYGYDTELPGSRSKQSIEHLGRNLLEQVVAFRSQNQVRKMGAYIAQANSLRLATARPSSSVTALVAYSSRRQEELKQAANSTGTRTSMQRTQ